MRRRLWAALAATLALSGLMAAAPGALAAGYTIQAVGETAVAINENGDVTGAIHSASIDFGAGVYRFSGGHLVDVSEPLRAIDAEARGINDLGDIVGSREDIDFVSSGFLLRGTTLVAGVGGERADAWDVNDAGEVVGVGAHFGDRHAFLWSDGVARDLGTLGGHDSAAFATGRRGQAAGEADVNARRTHAFLWSRGRMRDLGTLGGRSSRADDVTATNHVVGTAQIASGGRRAFLWTPAGGMHNLGPLVPSFWSSALALNGLDQVVGRANVAPRVAHAFLWTPAGGMVDLNTLIPPGSGWVLIEATDINGHGQIVGNGTLNGVAAGFLLTPAA